jgi:hypothetical protein
MFAFVGDQIYAMEFESQLKHVRPKDLKNHTDRRTFSFLVSFSIHFWVNIKK